MSGAYATIANRTGRGVATFIGSAQNLAGVMSYRITVDGNAAVVASDGVSGAPSSVHAIGRASGNQNACAIYYNTSLLIEASNAGVNTITVTAVGQQA